MQVIGDIATAAFVALAIAALPLATGAKKSWRLPILAAGTVFALSQAFELVRMARSDVKHPPLWDFRVFWMIGRIVASHHNVYEIASYQMYGAILNPGGDPEFNSIALNIGMPYPPPAILLLYPLGLVANISTALAAWYICIFGAIVASVVLLWRRFFRAQGAAGLLVVAILVLTLSATHLTIGLAQLDYFALLLLLLFWGERTPWRAGLWLAPLIVLRPLCLLLAVYFLVRRQWSALAALVGASFALLAISIPVVGPSAFASYLHQNPTARYPEIYFVGTQSLYKLLVYASGHHDGYFSLTAHPLFDVMAGIIIVAATAICAVAAKHQRDACLGLLLAAALFLYPNTDTHYCSLLLVPLCAVWRQRERFGLSTSAVAAIFFMQYLLLNVRYGAKTTGLLLALDCLLFAILALHRPGTELSVEPRLQRSTFATRSA